MTTGSRGEEGEYELGCLTLGHSGVVVSMSLGQRTKKKIFFKISVQKRTAPSPTKFGVTQSKIEKNKKK